MTETVLSHVLMIEDNPGDARLVQEMLKESLPHLQLTHFSDLPQPDPILVEKYHLILLDLNLPSSTGLETISKVTELMPGVPIVVLTGLDNEELSISAIQSGAQDYLVKGKTDPDLLSKTLKYAYHRCQILHKINAQNEEQKAYLSTHDILTGLPNQQLFLENLGLTIQRYTITRKTFSLVLLKIHETEKIITAFGHSENNKLIKEISSLLKNIYDESVFISRYKENIFSLLFPSHHDEATLYEDLYKLQEALTKPIFIENRQYFVSYNIGGAIFPFGGKSAETLVSNAYIALDNATEVGVQTCKVYKRGALPIIENNRKLQFNDLQAALQYQQFFLVYQPLVRIHDHKVEGVEALVRWNHPKYGLIMPGEFICIAEDCHFIGHIGAWVLEEAIRQYKVWQRKVSDSFLPLRISVNVSIQQLQHNSHNFYLALHNLLKDYDISPSCIDIELTESIFIKEAESIIDKLNQLKKLGVTISIDDFGQGYSSLSYLSHLPVDRLKLDKAFIDKNKEGTPTSLIVESIIKLAHDLRLKVLAEGVETAEQLQILKRQNCDEVQGYYFSKPLQPDLIDNIISQNLTINSSDQDNRISLLMHES